MTEDKTAHTPRPWRIGPRLTLGAAGFAFEIFDEDGHGIALVKYYYGELSASDVEANGNLIAAAPDLLAACKALLPSNPSRTDCNERACETCSTCAARAVIAKAEGR